MTGNPGLFDPAGGDEESTPSPFSGEPGGATEQLRAKIGRPAGARNRKSVDFERWYFAKGYTDPLQRLAELVTEDPRVLVAWFEEHAGVDGAGKARPAPPILDVVRMQIAAAAELAPYLHGKKPVSLELPDGALPALFILAGEDQLGQAQQLLDAKRRALAIGAGPVVEGEANEIKDLEPEK